MGGIIFLYKGEPRFLLPERLLNDEGNHDEPFSSALKKLQGLHRAHITGDDILDRSKATGLTKCLAVVQTTWFIVQFVARPIQGLALTELEVITCAYAVLNGVTFWLWKDKPLDVERPLIIDLDFEGFSTQSSAVNPTPSPPIEPVQPISSPQRLDRKSLIKVIGWIEGLVLFLCEGSW
jgi:hypothetical protein